MMEKITNGGASMTIMMLTCVMSALITALFARWFTTAVGKFKPSYTTVFLITLICGIGANLLGFAIMIYMAKISLIAGAVAAGVSGLAVFVVHSWALGAFMKHPETGPIGIKSGFVINFASIGAIVMMAFPVLLLVGVAAKLT